MLQKAPGYSPAAVRSTLSSTASPIANGSTYSTGAGLINALAAVSAATNPAPTPAVGSQVACRKLPKKIKRRGLTRVLPKHCRTNAGQKVRIRASAHQRGDLRLFKLVRKRNGKVLVRTYGYRIRLRLVQRANPTAGYAALKVAKAYKL
ncbi:MAG: hypothetical protein HQ526_06545, partial [Actinobacteria bacterium]|nr:hypothetical protein [Actinomycetota bacterium]